MRRSLGRLAGALLLLMLGLAAARADTHSLLRDDRDQPVAPSQLSGRWLLISFGYTHCPDVCPTTLHRISATLERLLQRGQRVPGYFVSVDPDHDSPAQLHRFLAGVSPQVHGLTGSPAALDDARRSFGVPTRRTGGGFDHGVFIYLVAPDGSVVDTFHPSTSVAVLTRRIAARLEQR